MKYKIALITASIGNPDKPELTITSECQKEFDDYGVDIYKFNDNDLERIKTFSIPELIKKDIYRETKYIKIRHWFRSLYYTSQKLYPTEKDNQNRLLAKIPRMLFFKLLPKEYDYYIWIDSKFTILEGWLGYILDTIEKNNDKDIIAYAHAERSSIQSEFNYMRYYMRKYNSKSLQVRYNLSEMDNQIFFYKKNRQFIDNSLFETGTIIYSNRILDKKEFLESWYAHNYYLTIQDQLSFPYLVFLNSINVGVLNESVCNVKYVKYNYY